VAPARRKLPPFDKKKTDPSPNSKSLAILQISNNATSPSAPLRRGEGRKQSAAIRDASQSRNNLTHPQYLNHKKSFSRDLTPGPSPPRRGEKAIRGNSKCELIPYNLTLSKYMHQLPGPYASRALPPKAPHAAPTSPHCDTAKCGDAPSNAAPQKPLRTKIKTKKTTSHPCNCHCLKLGALGPMSPHATLPKNHLHTKPINKNRRLRSDSSLLNKRRAGAEQLFPRGGTAVPKAGTMFSKGRNKHSHGLEMMAPGAEQ
jgi:hypothetical protein